MKQHYVPQLLLRRFASSTDGDHLFVYDKHTDNIFPAAISNAAAENGFYDFEVNGVKHSLEKFPLEMLETRAGATIKSLITDERTTHISAEDKSWVALFAVTQLLRTRREQSRSLALNHALRDAAIAVGGDPAKTTIEVDGDLVKYEVLTPEENRLFCLRKLGPLAETLAKHFDNKLWVLHKTSIDDPFLIGDSPITMYNSLNQHSFKSTIGVAVPGIEIYLPISSTLTLGFLCPTIRAFFRSTMLVAEWYLNALDGTRPMPMTRETTKHLNFLQVAHAERFVYANSDKRFDLVQEMIAADPAFRTGLKDS